MLMPHLGRPLTGPNANTGSNNMVSQTDPLESGAVTSRSILSTPEAMQASLDVAQPDESAGSMTTASDRSSPSFIRTPIIDSSTQADSLMQGDQALHRIRSTTFCLASEDELGIAGLNTAQDFETATQSFQSLNNEQLCEPIDWPPDLEIDWETELDAAVTFDWEHSPRKDTNETSLEDVGGGAESFNHPSLR